MTGSKPYEDFYEMTGQAAVVAAFLRANKEHVELNRLRLLNDPAAIIAVMTGQLQGVDLPSSRYQGHSVMGARRIDKEVRSRRRQDNRASARNLKAISSQARSVAFEFNSVFSAHAVYAVSYDNTYTHTRNQAGKARKRDHGIDGELIELARLAELDFQERLQSVDDFVDGLAGAAEDMGQAKSERLAVKENIAASKAGKKQIDDEVARLAAEGYFVAQMEASATPVSYQGLIEAFTDKAKKEWALSSETLAGAENGDILDFVADSKTIRMGILKRYAGMNKSTKEIEDLKLQAHSDIIAVRNLAIAEAKLAAHMERKTPDGVLGRAVHTVRRNTLAPVSTFFGRITATALKNVSEKVASKTNSMTANQPSRNKLSSFVHGAALLVLNPTSTKLKKGSLSFSQLVNHRDQLVHDVKLARIEGNAATERLDTLAANVTRAATARGELRMAADALTESIGRGVVKDFSDGITGAEELVTKVSLQAPGASPEEHVRRIGFAILSEPQPYVRAEVITQRNTVPLVINPAPTPTRSPGVTI